MSPRLAKKGQLITRVLNYIIPSTNVCGTLSLLRLREYTIVSFPNIVVGADLERGVYKFNLCFVLNRHDDPSVYEAIVHRLSIVLSWLERERQILSNPQTKLKFATNLVNQLYHGLNVFSGECIIDLSEIGTLSINAFSSADPFPPSPVDLCDVPVLLINLGRLIDSSCDQTVLRILSFIDGTKNVAQIAELTETDPEYVIDALRELSAAGTKRPNGQQVIDYISHFKFTNRYAADAGLSRILHDISLQKECYQFLGFISETEYDENNSNNINNGGNSAHQEGTGRVLDFYGDNNNIIEGHSDLAEIDFTKDDDDPKNDRYMHFMKQLEDLDSLALNSNNANDSNTNNNNNRNVSNIRNNNINDNYNPNLGTTNSNSARNNNNINFNPNDDEKSQNSDEGFDSDEDNNSNIGNSTSARYGLSNLSSHSIGYYENNQEISSPPKYFGYGLYSDVNDAENKKYDEVVAKLIDDILPSNEEAHNQMNIQQNFKSFTMRELLVTDDESKREFAWKLRSHTNGLELVRLYAEITPEYSIGDWMISIRFPIDRVDIRKFIAFGELKGLIRRIHKYPVFNPTMPSIGSPISSYNTLPQQHHSVNDANGNEMFLQIHSSPPPALQIELDERKSAIAQDERKPSVAQDVLDLLDGTRNYDQLSIHFRKTVEELDEWFSSDPRITFEYR